MSKYSFDDLFNADKNLTANGQGHRSQVSIEQLENLEKIFPKMKFN